jgi:hypothetical protein
MQLSGQGDLLGLKLAIFAVSARRSAGGRRFIFDVKGGVLKLLFVFMACVILGACSKAEKFVPMAQTSAPATAKSSTIAATSATPSIAPINYEEPPEQVLRDFMFIQYAALDAAGGLPVTVTASSKNGTLRAKLYTVTKDKCHRTPVSPPGMFECGVDLMATMWWDGRREPTEPGADSKRISVIQDSNGKWVDCTYTQENTGICRDGIKR